MSSLISLKFCKTFFYNYLSLFILDSIYDRKVNVSWSIWIFISFMYFFVNLLFLEFQLCYVCYSQSFPIFMFMFPTFIFIVPFYPFISSIIFVLILFFQTQCCWVSAIWPILFQKFRLFCFEWSAKFFVSLSSHSFLLFNLYHLLSSILLWLTIFWISQVECLVHRFSFLVFIYVYVYKLCLHMYTLPVCVP